MAYHEFEALKEFNYTVSEWQVETPVNRARCVAHCLHKGLRAGYEHERAIEKADGKNKKAPGADYGDYMKRMGLQ